VLHLAAAARAAHRGFGKGLALEATKATSEEEGAVEEKVGDETSYGKEQQQAREEGTQIPEEKRSEQGAVKLVSAQLVSLVAPLEQGQAWVEREDEQKMKGAWSSRWIHLGQDVLLQLKAR